MVSALYYDFLQEVISFNHYHMLQLLQLFRCYSELYEPSFKYFIQLSIKNESSIYRVVIFEPETFPSWSVYNCITKTSILSCSLLSSIQLPPTFHKLNILQNMALFFLQVFLSFYSQLFFVILKKVVSSTIWKRVQLSQVHITTCYLSD